MLFLLFLLVAEEVLEPAKQTVLLFLFLGGLQVAPFDFFELLQGGAVGEYLHAEDLSFLFVSELEGEAASWVVE